MKVVTEIYVGPSKINIPDQSEEMIPYGSCYGDIHVASVYLSENSKYIIEAKVCIRKRMLAAREKPYCWRVFTPGHSIADTTGVTVESNFLAGIKAAQQMMEEVSGNL